MDDYKMAKKDPKFAQELRQWIKKWDDYWRFNREQYYEFMDFVMGDMWKEDESKVFTRYDKIPLTANKLAPLASWMIGEQQRNTPVLQVVPDENTPQETVEVREALVRNITFQPASELSYQTGFQSSIIGGFGACGVGTEYEDSMSLKQVIVPFEIRDPCKCYWDISAKNPSKTDSSRSGYRTRVSRTAFRGEHGEKIERSIPSSSYSDDTTPMSFNDDDSITVIDDYELKYKSFKIYELSNGKVIKQKELDALERVDIEGQEVLVMDYEIVEILDERETFEYRVVHTKVAGDYILERNDFPAKQSPIVFIDQNSYWDKSGKQICRPFFKDARDSQRFLNYLTTQIAYLIKISRYDQFIASKANIKSADTQAAWRDPFTVQGTLFYDESPNGNKPERLSPPELSQSLSVQYERALQDIQTSTGIYATQLGEQGNETSGKAVDKRTRQSSHNTNVPYNSLKRAITCIGEIINEMIPVVYDTERKMMLKMQDQMVKPVILNESIDQYGTGKRNDMTQGKYKIRLLPGPSHEGQKEQAMESFQMVLQANPQLFSLIADLYAENLPLQNNIELRNRLRTIVSPEIIEAGKTGQPLPQKNEGPPPEIMIKLQELELKKQQLQLAMQDAQMKAQKEMQELALKQHELEVKVDHDKQRVVMEWHKLEAEKLQAAAKLEEQEMRYKGEMARISQDADTTHANNLTKLLIHSHPHEKKESHTKEGK
jgi:hypothetical protein